MTPVGSPHAASPAGAVLRLWKVGPHPELLSKDAGGRAPPQKAGSGILLMSVMLVCLVGK